MEVHSVCLFSLTLFLSWASVFTIENTLEGAIALYILSTVKTLKPNPNPVSSRCVLLLHTPADRFSVIDVQTCCISKGTKGFFFFPPKRRAQCVVTPPSCQSCLCQLPPISKMDKDVERWWSWADWMKPKCSNTPVSQSVHTVNSA